jgi:hypothetical protein
MSEIKIDENFICSDNFFRFGEEYTPKILKKLKIEIYERSIIDGGVLLDLDAKNYMQRNWLDMFFNYQRCPILDDYMPNYKCEIAEPFFTPNGNKYVLKIVDFSNDGWRNYLKIIRKKKFILLNNG